MKRSVHSSARLVPQPIRVPIANDQALEVGNAGNQDTKDYAFRLPARPCQITGHVGGLAGGNLVPARRSKNIAFMLHKAA